VLGEGEAEEREAESAGEVLILLLALHSADLDEEYVQQGGPLGKYMFESGAAPRGGSGERRLENSILAEEPAAGFGRAFDDVLGGLAAEEHAKVRVGRSECAYEALDLGAASHNESRDAAKGNAQESVVGEGVAGVSRQIGGAGPKSQLGVVPARGRRGRSGGRG
jgi:hypothetical protein